MQHILNTISVVAFIMSTISWILAIFNNSIKLSLEVWDYSQRFNVIQLYIYFQNNSGKYLTITGVSIIENQIKRPCKLIPSTIRTKNNKPFIETPYLPVNLSPHQGVCFAFEFLNCSDIALSPGKNLALEIYTNRKALKRSVILGNKDHILNLR